MLCFGNTICAAQMSARPKSSNPFYEKLSIYVSPRVSGEMKDGKNTYFEDPNIELLAPSCIAALICYANAIYDHSIGESQVKGFVDLIPANDRLITRKADIHQDCRSRAGTSKSEHYKRARSPDALCAEFGFMRTFP